MRGEGEQILHHGEVASPGSEVQGGGTLGVLHVGGRLVPQQRQHDASAGEGKKHFIIIVTIYILIIIKDIHFLRE